MSPLTGSGLIIVLPGGGLVPMGIAGTWMKDHFDEWNRQNPNQLAAGVLFHEVARVVTLVMSPWQLYAPKTRSGVHFCANLSRTEPG